MRGVANYSTNLGINTSDLPCSLNGCKPICWALSFSMSVLCPLTNGWIISHDHFVRNIYERIEGIPARRFAFDSSLFQINTPFVRTCFKKDSSVHEVNCLASPPRKRRKKTENGPVNIKIKDVSKSNIYVFGW